MFELLQNAYFIPSVSVVVVLIALFIFFRATMKKKILKAAMKMREFLQNGNHVIQIQPVVCTSYGYESNTLDGRVSGLFAVSNQAFLFQPFSKTGDLVVIPRDPVTKVSTTKTFENVPVNLSRAKFLVIEPGDERRIGFLMKQAEEVQKQLASTAA